MKKTLCTVAALCLSLGAFALPPITMGLKASFELPSAGSSFADGNFKDDMTTLSNTLSQMGVDVKENTGFGGSANFFTNFQLFQNDALTLGVQPEIGFSLLGWYYLNASGSMLGQTYSLESPFGWVCLDLPVLVTVGVDLTSWFGLEFGIGPQLSFYFLGGGDQTLKVNGSESSDALYLESEPEMGILFGMVAEANAKFYLSKSWGLIAGLKYSMDFTPTTFNVEQKVSGERIQISRYDESKAFRRSLGITVGVQKKF
ncbi:MAG: hypothetical protein ILP07_10470 [Treponema sp.]|nr:hypothetical protein [Treponema sp.]